MVLMVVLKRSFGCPNFFFLFLAIFRLTILTAERWRQFETPHTSNKWTRYKMDKKETTVARHMDLCHTAKVKKALLYS